MSENSLTIDAGVSGAAASARRAASEALQFHPVAAIFPLMTGAEFEELVEDIRAHGLISPIVLHEGKVLDGRNRYRACLTAKIEPRFTPFTGTDPLAFVISVNMRRRHLTRAQKREVIAELLKAKPDRSDLATAKLAKVSDKTVTAVRKDMESRSEIPNVPARKDSKGRVQPGRKAGRTGLGDTAALIGGGPARRRGAERSPAASTNGEVVHLSQVKAAAAHYSDWHPSRKERERGVVKACVFLRPQTSRAASQQSGSRSSWSTASSSISCSRTQSRRSRTATRWAFSRSRSLRRESTPRHRSRHRRRLGVALRRRSDRDRGHAGRHVARQTPSRSGAAGSADRVLAPDRSRRN